MKEKIEITMQLPDDMSLLEEEPIMAWLISAKLGCSSAGIYCSILIDGKPLKFDVLSVAKVKNEKPS